MTASRIVRPSDRLTRVTCLQIRAAVSERFTRQECEQALQHLEAEAHIYNTIDDFHYRMT